jgi:glycine/D-amino acid oxidase-like deaminating enzyme
VEATVVSGTRTHRIRASHVVLAVGSAARLVLPNAARLVRPVRAQALSARITPVPPWTRPVYATRGGDYWRQLEDGRVLIGGMRRARKRQENTRASAPSRPVQSALDTLLRDLVGPDAGIEVEHRWAGTMAFTRSGLPWAGAVPRRKGITLVAGMNGHGMGWGPGLAAAVAAHLRGEGPPPPETFRPGR